MGTQQELFLQALIERFPNPQLHSLLESAPESILSKFRSLPERAGISPEALWTAPRALLLSIHPSWHEELVDRCPKTLQPKLRSVLKDAQSHPLNEIDPLKLFLLDYLVSQWPDKDVQGLETIGEAPLRWLADCDEQLIRQIADLLAVHDVVDILRQILDKKTLQMILKPFSPLQQRYLRALLRRPIRSVSLNKELLSLIRNDPEKAKKQLVQRGQERFAQALKEAPPLLVWHVLHHLPQKQARSLMELVDRPASKAELAGALKGAAHAYEFLKRTKP